MVRLVRDVPLRGVAGAVDARRGRAREAVYLGDRGRRESAANRLVQHEVHDAALDVQRVVVQSPLPSHPAVAGAMVEGALRRVPSLDAAQILESKPLLCAAERILVA